MKYIILLCWLSAAFVNAQAGFSYCRQVGNGYPKSTTSYESTEDSLLKTMRLAAQTQTFTELAQIIAVCKTNYSRSTDIAIALAGWLTESHPIYTEKGFNETIQFRAYLLYELSFFKPTDQLLKYIKYELNFADNQNVIGGAIYTARLFPGDSSLLNLVERYNTINFNRFVNFASYDVLLASEKNYNLQEESIATISYLKTGNHTKKNCCSSDDAPGISDEKITPAGNIIALKNRSLIKESIAFYDQYGNTIRFNSLRGRPFVLTFFYTSCTNPKKCANTIHQLAVLQKQFDIASHGQPGIYAVSYDTYIDKPEVLKKYGDAYGFAFTARHKFLVPQNEIEKQKLMQLLYVKVGYVNGIVNQHGTQVFVFDKKGRIAMALDNEGIIQDKLLKALTLLKKE